MPGESQGWGSLVGCHLWGLTELDMTEATQQQQQHVLQTPAKFVVLLEIIDQGVSQIIHFSKQQLRLKSIFQVFSSVFTRTPIHAWPSPEPIYSLNARVINLSSAKCHSKNLSSYFYFFLIRRKLLIFLQDQSQNQGHLKTYRS